MFLLLSEINKDKYNIPFLKIPENGKNIPFAGNTWSISQHKMGTTPWKYRIPGENRICSLEKEKK